MGWRGSPDTPDDVRQGQEDAFRNFRIEMRDYTMINSWCLSEHESISMWDRYADKDGLAILSDVSSLKSSFTGDEEVYIGVVHYIDYQRDLIRITFYS